MWRCALLGILASILCAADLPLGQIIDDVKCAADPAQSYALYLPSNYTPEKTWSVILAFDPLGRGRAPVVQYQAAAEKYGYIVAGSNNSRNGPWNISLTAAQAMSADVRNRFAVDEKRIYAAGQSGGARVSMALALSTSQFAGVFASSAGFPDSRPRTLLPFPVFATAGTDDFNYVEMRRFDRVLTSPHRLVVFEGGHTWLPSEIAVEAVEWMEIQEMKSGRRPHDDSLLDRIFAARSARVDALTRDVDIYIAVSSLASDFDGLRDVARFAARAGTLAHRKDIQQALKNDRAQEQHEEQLSRELAQLLSELDNPATRRDGLDELRTRLTKLARQAGADEDSADRRLARRVLWALIVDNRSRPDPELQKLLGEVQPAKRP